MRASLIIAAILIATAGFGQTVGMITKVEGKATVGARAAAVGNVLQQGNQVATSAAGKVELLYCPAKVRVSLGPNSRVVLADAKLQIVGKRQQHATEILLCARCRCWRGQPRPGWWFAGAR